MENKSFFEKWNSVSLPLRIFVGMCIGAALGVICPSQSWITLLGSMFVGALKAVAPILVFVLVVSSLAFATKGVGTKFKTVLGLYMASTLMSAFTAVAACFIWPVTLTLTKAAEGTAPPSGISQVLGTLLNNMTMNPVNAIGHSNYIAILFWSILLGLALKTHASETTKEVFSHLADSVSQIVRWIISMAPFGIMGLVFDTVANNGVEVFVSYGKLLMVLIGCMLFVFLVIDAAVCGFCLKKNPYPLVLRCARESGVTAFFTRSSAANIPVNMGLCERLGLDKDFYSVSIPLGATINMNGAAITITVMTLAAVHTLGVQTDLASAFILSVLATVAACGASGVAGGSLLLIPMACSLFGIGADISMQVVGVGFIIGVLQDSFETAINSAGDVMYTAAAEAIEWRKEGKEIKF